MMLAKSVFSTILISLLSVPAQNSVLRKTHSKWSGWNPRKLREQKHKALSKVCSAKDTLNFKLNEIIVIRSELLQLQMNSLNEENAVKKKELAEKNDYRVKDRHLKLQLLELQIEEQKLKIHLLQKQCIKEFLGKHLFNISDIYFAYFALSANCGQYKHGSRIPITGHPNGGIRIFLSQRQPHEALAGDSKGKLLVVSYAWDGNSLPGNEFWSGKLASTGDSAAASSTQISELHHPHINRRVCSKTLKIAARGKIYDFENYLQCNSKRKWDEEASGS
ncbi:protein of unknown function (DUF4804) [Popillia japonica]|uniref:Uncharacterized protein n=1 Tax=Popillia japonica TaxID=7064 RepID=A0AAW1IC92_POPJA